MQHKHAIRQFLWMSSLMGYVYVCFCFCSVVLGCSSEAMQPGNPSVNFAGLFMADGYLVHVETELTCGT